MKKFFIFLLPFFLWGESFFDEILLVIHFNHPHYENIAFIEEIYGPHFPNKVYYGELPHKKVHVVKNRIGYFLHRTVKDVLLKFPGYRGYIFCQDDCLMNFWNYPRFDRDKIWYQKGFGSVDLEQSVHPWWSWWNRDIGHAAISQTYEKLPTPFREQLEHNLGSNCVGVSWADFFYVPATKREECLEICDCFDDPPVFLEIAIPTMISSLDSMESWEEIIPFWGGTGKSADFSNYHMGLDWFHPVKFSDPANREYVRALLEEKRSGADNAGVLLESSMEK